MLTTTEVAKGVAQSAIGLAVSVKVIGEFCASNAEGI